MKENSVQLKYDLQTFAEDNMGENKSMPKKNPLMMSDDEIKQFLSSKGVTPEEDGTAMNMQKEEMQKPAEQKMEEATETTMTTEEPTKKVTTDDIKPKNDIERESFANLMKSLTDEIKGIVASTKTNTKEEPKAEEKKLTQEELDEMIMQDNESLTNNPKEFINSIVSQAVKQATEPLQEYINKLESEKMYKSRADRFFESNPDANAEELLEMLNMLPEIDSREDALEIAHKLSMVEKLKNKETYDDPMKIKTNHELLEKILEDDDIKKAFEKKYLESIKSKDTEEAPVVLGNQSGGKATMSEDEGIKSIKDATKRAMQNGISLEALIGSRK